MPEPNSPQDLPEIPSFRSEKKEEKRGLGLPPLGRSSTTNPILKLRGLPSASTLFERLKQLKKKDLMFIASGLSVLFLAPLAEHFMLGPGPESNVLRRGFDVKGFPVSVVSPYEPGTGGLAPGGLPGQTNDIITLLNVRDPAALILRPGAEQQPTTPAAGAGAEKPSYRDAVAEAARAGAARAAEAGGLPSARGALSGSLRGLGAVSGGSSVSFTLPPISVTNVPGRGGP